MIENTNIKQFYPGPILNNALEITDFLFNDAEQIKIKHSKLNEEGILIDVDLNYPTDYEVTKVLPSAINAAEAALTASMGQIMLKNVNVLAGEKLTAYRVSQIIQDKDYPRTGAFPAATHEGALDYLTMQNQEQKDEIDRALKVPISAQNFEGSLPLPIPSRALKINNDGTGFEMSKFDPDIALITTENFKNEAQQAATEALASQNTATEKAQIATEKAQIATEKAEETLQTYETAMNDFETIRVNNIDEINGIVAGHLDDLNSLDATIKKDAEDIINRVGISMFDTILKDHILTYEETKGLALQGTYVYKEALAGSRYGYPDFYNKCLEEYNEATSTETINGIEVKVHSNGHKFYDIANKTAIDDFFNSIGSAWFYGVDTENERIFLPRNNYLTSYISNGDKSVAVYGNGMSLGLTDGVANVGLQNGLNTSYGYLFACNQTYGKPLGTTSNVFTANFIRSLGITKDSSKSGIVGNINLQNSQNGMYLYICVGNTTNYEGMSEVVNQGMEILDQVNQGIESRIKLDGSNAEFPVVVESYQNGNSGYILYSPDQNGRTRCIQWGFKESVGSYGQTTINLLKPIQVPYVVQANIDWANSLTWYTNTGAVDATAMTDITAVPTDKTSNSFKLQSYSKHSWRIDGYLI